MKASVSTYRHCRDHDRPHRSAEWERGAGKGRVGRPWRCIVNFKPTPFARIAASWRWRRILQGCFAGCLDNITELLSSLSLSGAGSARVKLCFVWGGIGFPRDPVSEVRFCIQSLSFDRTGLIYTCITTRWQGAMYCMCVLVLCRGQQNNRQWTSPFLF